MMTSESKGAQDGVKRKDVMRAQTETRGIIVQ